MEHSLVQILVVVANTKEKSLWAEVEKGSTRTAIDRGLIDPKQQINFGKKRNTSSSFYFIYGFSSVVKGIQVKIPVFYSL